MNFTNLNVEQNNLFQLDMFSYYQQLLFQKIEHHHRQKVIFHFYGLIIIKRWCNLIVIFVVAGAVGHI